jgi:hypothetical protein
VRYAQTMAFTTLMLFQIFNVVNVRSDDISAFVGLFTNHWLWTARASQCGVRASSSAGLRNRLTRRRGLATVYRHRELGLVGHRDRQAVGAVASLTGDERLRRSRSRGGDWSASRRAARVPTLELGKGSA